ncbi:MAG TPA: hypothetical protein VM819_05050 [Vicinamibacterales bacterium]|nr:hypothetical protein [Vicinamibacterales bacterium]
MEKPNDPIPIQTHASRRQAGYAEWLAVGAVAAGTVGAIVGMANCRHHAARSHEDSEPMDPATLTAPHGDKLRGAVV